MPTIHPPFLQPCDNASNILGKTPSRPLTFGAKIYTLIELKPQLFDKLLGGASRSILVNLTLFYFEGEHDEIWRTQCPTCKLSDGTFSRSSYSLRVTVYFPTLLRI